MDSGKETTLKLYLDILILIVECFAFDPDGRDLKTLASLGRTCRSLLPVCQKHIFSTLSITPRKFHRPHSKTDYRDEVSDYEAKLFETGDEVLRVSIAFDTMECILRSNPGVADCVRTLYYHSQVSNLEDLDAATTVLSQFKHVEELVIRQFHSFRTDDTIVSDSEDDIDDDRMGRLMFYTPLNWKTLSPAVRQALVNIIYLPTFNTLELNTIKNFPLEILLFCPNLRSLRILYSHVLSSSSTVHIPGDYNAIKPRSIRLIPGAHSNARALRHGRPDGLPYLDLSQIRFLGMVVDNPAVSRQLDSMLDGLCQLEGLEVSFISNALYDLIEVVTNRAPSLINLRHLSLQGAYQTCYAPHVCTLELFDHFPALNHLETLVLTLKPFKDHDRHTLDDLYQLAVRLSTIGFMSLRSLTLSIDTYDYGSAKDREEWCAQALAHMASSSNDNLAFDIVLKVPMY